MTIKPKAAQHGSIPVCSALAALLLMVSFVASGSASAQSASDEARHEAQAEANQRALDEAARLGWDDAAEAVATEVVDPLNLREQGFSVAESVVHTAEGSVYMGVAYEPSSDTRSTEETADAEQMVTCFYKTTFSTVRKITATTVRGQATFQVGSTCPGGPFDVWAQLMKDDGIFGDQVLGGQIGSVSPGGSTSLTLTGSCGGSNNEYYMKGAYGTYTNGSVQYGPRSTISC